MRRLIGSVIVIVVLVGVGLAVAGVLRFENTRNQSSITLDKKELQQKTEKAVEKTEAAGGEILDKTGQALHQAAQSLTGSSDKEKLPAKEQPPAKTPAPGDGKNMPDSKGP